MELFSRVWLTLLANIQYKGKVLGRGSNILPNRENLGNIFLVWSCAGKAGFFWTLSSKPDVGFLLLTTGCVPPTGTVILSMSLRIFLFHCGAARYNLLLTKDHDEILSCYVLYYCIIWPTREWGKSIHLFFNSETEPWGRLMNYPTSQTESWSCLSMSQIPLHCSAVNRPAAHRAFLHSTKFVWPQTH